MRALFLAAAMAFAPPVVAKEASAWRPVDEAAGQISDKEGLEALAASFPDSGSVRLRLLRAQLAEQDFDGVLDSLAWLKQRGYVFSVGAQEQFPSLVGTERAQAAKDLLIASPEIIEASEIIAIVPAEAGLTESVVRDLRTNTLALTSQSGNSIWKIASSEKYTQSAYPEGYRFSGIVYRKSVDQLWASVSGVPNPFDEMQLASGLMSLCLEHACNKQLMVMHSQAKSMNDLVAAKDGTLYASDSVGGGVYRHENGSKSLEPVVSPGTFRSPQGLAVSPDGARLYVSDYRYGIAIIDLKTREVSRLAADIPVILDGVDGLLLNGSELIAVQNGTSPMRISAFMLSDDGERVIGHRLLEQAHRQWTEPLSGSIDGNSLIYIGNGQWDRYVDGELAAGKEPLPTEIRRLPLGDPR